MVKKRSLKLSLILGAYFLVTSMVLGTCLLYWTYHSTIRVVNNEIEKSFTQRYKIAGQLIEREAEQIATTVYEIQLNNNLLAKITGVNSEQAQKVFENYADNAVRHKQDVLFISTLEQPVWLDASSPVPNVKPVLHKIAAKCRKFLSKPQVLNVSSYGSRFTGIFRSAKLVSKDNEVLGIVVAGTILNDNLLLMRTIQNRTETPQIILADNSKAIASTSGMDPKKLEEIVTCDVSKKSHETSNFHRDSTQNILYGHNRINLLGTPTSLDIIFALDDQVLSQVQSSYLDTLYAICAVITLFLMITLFTVKSLIYPSINRVLQYTKSAHHHNQSTLLEPGSITEFNIIGSAMTQMVSSINEAQVKLQESEAILRGTINSTADGILVVDYRGNILRSNSRFARMWNIPEEMVEEADDAELIDFVLDQVKDPLEFTRGVKALYASSEDSFDEISLNDGRVFERYSYCLIRDNTEIGRVWNFRDITDRKQYENNLDHLQNYLSNIINSMPSILIGVTLYGKITQWNKEAERIFGVSSEAAVGCEFVKIAPRFESEVSRINEAIKSREVRSKLKQSHIVDGEVHYEDITIYPLNAEGIQGAVIRIDDVTNQVKVDNMMIQTEKINSLGGLAAGMAHEINNPLAIISQGIHNVIRRLDPKRQMNTEAAANHGVNLSAFQDFLTDRRIMVFLNNCLDAVDRAAGIVKNMLMFSRRSDSSPSMTNLNELIEHTIELGSTDYDMKKKYDFKFIKIVKEYDSDIHDVMCCAAEIEQVLLNLFKNALQAMEEVERDDYKPLFHVRTRNEATHVRVEIEDNGPGIPDGIKSRIFEPFYTTKPVGIGTGLGLSVSYMIITQNHSGTFEVESEYGKYTRFIIRLPINKRFAGDDVAEI